ncbi:hypothetical protein [Kribbella deserti]|uniref:Uncharacterized protein n=1 Tax=Kribbella deserti TaxID=1926257 RepID=A0ABV6QNG0_9ACTN
MSQQVTLTALVPGDVVRQHGRARTVATVDTFRDQQRRIVTTVEFMDAGAHTGPADSLIELMKAGGL